MRVGDVQQREVAERRNVVQLARGLRAACSRPQACPRRGGEGEEAKEFSALQLPVYRGRRVEQEPDKVLDLLRG